MEEWQVEYRNDLENIEKSKLNSEKLWKIWKISKLNSEKIQKIQKKRVKRQGKYRRKIS